MDTKMKRTPMPNMSDAAAQRAMLNSNVSPRAELWAINIIADRDRLLADNARLREALRQIAQLPVHPSDDARNQAGLMVARNNAADALVKAKGGA